MYKLVFKRAIDLIIAAIVFIVTLPLFLLICSTLYIANDGKVFFSQVRPGKQARPFRLLKFKTMSDKRDEYGNLLADDKRLTKTGALIRKTSLDELPQLLNVLKGDMSLIGPRPLLMEYLALYNTMQARRHEVRPGITGWAQVNGRNAISWQKKFEYDIWYVDHLSFLLDMKILFLTVLKVFKADGISSTASVTMEKFRGNFDSRQ